MKYRIAREIKLAEGYQTIEVEAVDEDAAFLLFKAGEGDIVEECVEVIESEEISFHDIYET